MRSFFWPREGNPVRAYNEFMDEPMHVTSSANASMSDGRAERTAKTKSIYFVSFSECNGRRNEIKRLFGLIATISGKMHRKSALTKAG